MNNTRFSAAFLPFFLFTVLLLPLLHGCSAKKPTGEIPEHTPVTLSCQLQEGDNVLVRVSGSKDGEEADFATIVRMSLQHELGIRPVKAEQDADVIIDVKIYDIYLADSQQNGSSGSNVLLSTAAGTGLGMFGGGLVSGTRTGSLVGAGLGAAVGLGLSLQDNSSLDTWALDADISWQDRDRNVTRQKYRTTVYGRNMERKAALDALGTQLSRDIVKAVRNY